ncbi:unnamed protein product [Soboliphyme baturini]|uniref:Uncharacterized protein n=1 Tax=Soboliphyme baturini TaxID=241478 RepID=A0A183IRB4_9BILA|nr:unnamed protein product [Soboliphyme baturini]
MQLPLRAGQHRKMRRQDYTTRPSNHSHGQVTGVRDATRCDALYRNTEPSDRRSKTEERVQWTDGQTGTRGQQYVQARRNTRHVEAK